MIDTGSPKDFEVSVTSGPEAVRDALSKILDGLMPWSLDIEETTTIELVLAEVLNNVVEHAYPTPGETGPIDVSVSCLQNGLHFIIRDFGCPMPDGEAPIGRDIDLDVDTQDLPEGGFGWFLIRDLAKDVVYTRIGDANELSLRIAIPG